MIKKKFIKKRNILLIFAIVLISISLISFKILDDGDDFQIAKSFDVFHNVVREIRLFYVDDADISKMINESTEEFLEKLDPYTVYYPESKMEEFTFMTTGAYGGVGALILEKDNILKVTDIYQNSPADKANLKIADKIISINGIEIDKNNISDLKELLKGESGSELKLIIKREATGELLKKTIIREKIVFDNIPTAKLLDNNFVYLKLNQFNQNAGNEVKQKLTDLNLKAKLNGIILDLRNNPGGLLNEAVNIVSLFVNKGSDIVSTKGRVKDWDHLYKAESEPIFKDVPLIVLINSGSASASEIVAGAVQDLDRGIIIGQRSYGKGLVQITRKMNYNTRIKLTTAKYYIPSGRCIQAIDYSHRNPDGSVGHISDSLISKFKTSNGRTVFDGGGIEPDIKIDFDSLSVFTKELLRNEIIFDFATKYYYENKEIVSSEKFNITNEIYSDFTIFALKNPIKFSTKSDRIADNLFNTVKNEKYGEDIQNKIKELKSSLKLDKKKALSMYKEQIIPILDYEIIKRYYYEKGVIESSLKYDNELKAAIEILNNNVKYNSVLSNIND